MNVLEAIRGRRSIRKYQDRQIPREDLEKILKETGAIKPDETLEELIKSGRAKRL